MSKNMIAKSFADISEVMNEDEFVVDKPKH
jgi:hypothetical protein